MGKPQDEGQQGIIPRVSDLRRKHLLPSFSLSALHLPIHSFTHLLAHPPKHTHAHARMHARMHTHTHSLTHTLTHTHSHTHSHTNTHTHTHTHTHKHTHTHIHARGLGCRHHCLQIWALKHMLHFSPAHCRLQVSADSYWQVVRVFIFLFVWPYRVQLLHRVPFHPAGFPYFLSSFLSTFFSPAVRGVVWSSCGEHRSRPVVPLRGTQPTHCTTAVIFSCPLVHSFEWREGKGERNLAPLGCFFFFFFFLLIFIFNCTSLFNKPLANFVVVCFQKGFFPHP